MIPGPDFAVRVAGMPVGTYLALGTPVLSGRLTELVLLGSWLRTEAAHMSDALYQLIGEPSSDKSRLVALRRAVFRDRSPDRLLGQVALPAELRARIEAWCGARAERERLRAELPALLAADQAAALPALRGLAAEPALQLGLANASPHLLADVQRWLASGADRLPDRRTLTALLRYAGRTALKTSPRSTFTTSGVGSWDAAAQWGRPRTVAELRPDIFAALVADIAQLPPWSRG